MDTEANMKAWDEAISVFNKDKGDVSAMADLFADSVVHHQPLPGAPDVIGKLPLIAFYQTAVAQGWEKIEPLAEWGYDDLTVAVIESTTAAGNTRSVGITRWQDGKIAEVWTVGLRLSG
jgi:hypothetical protein